MNKEKKISFMQAEIDKLKRQLDELQQENQVLIQENLSLKNLNASKQEMIDSLNMVVTEIQSQYGEGLKELREAEKAYKDARISIINLQNNYKKEINSHLHRLRSQK